MSKVEQVFFLMEVKDIEKLRIREFSDEMMNKNYKNEITCQI